MKKAIMIEQALVAMMDRDHFLWLFLCRGSERVFLLPDGVPKLCLPWMGRADNFVTFYITHKSPIIREIRYV